MINLLSDQVYQRNWPCDLDRFWNCEGHIISHVHIATSDLEQSEW